MNNRRPETAGEVEELRAGAQSNHASVTLPTATRIVSLRAGDPLPDGARFCQIVGSKLEQDGGGARRVYLVLVEHVS